MSGYLKGCTLRPLLVGVTTPLALRAVEPSSAFIVGMIAMLAPFGVMYEWDPLSTDPDDGSIIIRPNDIAPANPGRWLLLTRGVSAPAPAVFELNGPYNGATPGTWVGGPIVCGTPREISLVTMVRRAAGTGGDTTVDVYLNGSSIFAAAGDRPTVAFGAGDYAISKKAPTLPAVCASGDIIDVALVDAELGGATKPEGLCVIVSFGG